MNELLGAMAEAREGIQRDMSAEKEENRRKEAEKKRMGKEMVARSLARKTKHHPKIETYVDTRDGEEEPVFKKRRFNGSL